MSSHLVSDHTGGIVGCIVTSDSVQDLNETSGLAATLRRENERGSMQPPIMQCPIHPLHPLRPRSPVEGVEGVEGLSILVTLH